MKKRDAVILIGIMVLGLVLYWLYEPASIATLLALWQWKRVKEQPQPQFQDEKIDEEIKQNIEVAVAEVDDPMEIGRSEIAKSLRGE